MILALTGFVVAPVAEAAACGFEAEYATQDIVTPLVDGEQTMPSEAPADGDEDCVHGHCHHHQQVNVNSATAQSNVETRTSLFAHFEDTRPDSVLESQKPPPRA